VLQDYLNIDEDIAVYESPIHNIIKEEIKIENSDKTKGTLGRTTQKSQKKKY